MEWDQLGGDAKEKEKLSAGAAIHSGLESQYNDYEKNYMWLQLEDAQEKEKMTESGEDNLILTWMLIRIVTWMPTSSESSKVKKVVVKKGLRSVHHKDHSPEWCVER